MRFEIFFCTLLFISVALTEVFSQQKEVFKLQTVVIDPGHGGNDSGATYGNFKEKDIVLDVSLKLGNMIKKSFPDVKVVYTRDKDVFIPLNERGKIANKAKGDLFMSIHVNSVKNAPSARGIETFTIGMHKSAANLEVAKKENSVITLENGYEQTYEGFDPNDEESYIMFSLGQHAYQRQSLSFSHEVQTNLCKYFQTSDRGMKQAGFLVLWTTSMPSILTELGFISNAKDREFLCSNNGKEKMATALFEAFSNYKKGIEIVSVYNTSSVADVKKSDTTQVPTTTVSTSETNSTYYSVQFLSSSVNHKVNSARFNIVKGKVFVIKDKNVYKYYADKNKSYEEILSLQKLLRANGYKDAFAVAFKDGVRVSINDAKKTLK